MKNLADYSLKELLDVATKSLAMNKECYVAQWVIQNKDKNINDYTIVIQDYYDEHGHHCTFTMELKERNNE